MTSCALLLAWILWEPPAGDYYRLPPVEVLRDGCRFNQAYQRHLEKQLEWAPYCDGPALRAALADAKAVYKVWDDAWGAHPEYKCTEERKRQYRRDYRLVVGRDGYREAWLPPCVPTWRFGELRY